MTPSPLTISRRDFVKIGTAAGGGLVLAFQLPAKGRGDDAESPNEHVFEPNAFVRIGRDGAVTIIANHCEMGQGVYTSLAMVLADELDADWSQVRVEAAPVDAVYNHLKFGSQATGGSSSTWTEWTRFRTAGATARSILIAAAARIWRVDTAICRAQNGRVINADTDESLEYGKLVDTAATLPPPADVTLKEPKDFTIIGKRVKRIDTPEKVDGSSQFGIDVVRPGMLTAVLARPPVLGGSVKRFDARKAKRITGVRDVVQLERGIAVVATGYWAALQGRRALTVEWEHGALSGLSSDSQRKHYAALATKKGMPASNTGNVETGMSVAARNVEAVYEVPYLAHAPMEPLNCVADVRADGCDVWTGTQFQTAEREAVARITGLPRERIHIHTMMLGGGFGRRAVLDCHFVSEAVELSAKIKAPVKVIWSREDDIQGGYYRPAALHALTGGLDKNGRIIAWRHRVVTESFVAGTPLEGMMMKQGVDRIAVEGAHQIPYAIPNIAVEWHHAPSGPPTLWWRSVGHSHNAFAVECFLDELIHAAGQDPVDARRTMLKAHPRHLSVLNLAAEKSNWGATLPDGHGRGIAVHESFGSFVAQVAEVSISSTGTLRVHRVVCAIDCGPVVNPDTIEAQMDSGVVFGLSAALYGAITFDQGHVQQSNFHDYPMLRMNEMPVVETHIVSSTENMGGIGEIAVPPIAPAVMNAVFDATGRRVRRLPFRLAGTGGS